jgi:type IV pilus assembly protein PilE
MKRNTGGFSMIEILIAVAIISILTAVAVPAYGTYVQRTRLTEAFTGLAGVGPTAEQYWSNNRTFADITTDTTTGSTTTTTVNDSLATRLPPETDNFRYTVSNLSATTYTVTATGKGPAADFKFTVDQSGTRATTQVPTGWTASTSCWVDRKEGLCSQ